MFGLNAIFAFGGAALGRRLDPYFSFNYLIEIDGLLTGGFSEVGGLGGRIGVETVHDGGNLGAPRQQLGGTTWTHRTVGTDSGKETYGFEIRHVVVRDKRYLTQYLIDRSKAPTIGSVRIVPLP